jgi:pimeloyl-ACP methyl ester carboxylesterase
MRGVGHFPMLEDPEVFNRLLADILTRHELMP